MRFGHAIFVTVLCLAACSRGIADRPRFQGQVAITIGAREVRGRLTWARPEGARAGTLQFDEVREGHAENLTLVAPALTVAFRDGVPRPVTANDRRLLAALATVFGWGTPLEGVPAPTRVAGKDAVRFADGVEVSVTVLAEQPAGPHGG